jgi:exopolysaccharide production repressor protein
MSFVLFFRGMLAALLIFAVATFVLTGSLWSTIWQTIICAVVLQVGYFIGVLWLVWRADNKPAASVAQEEAGPWERQGKIVADARKLPGTSFSHRP